MAYKISIAVEVVNPNDRNALIEALTDTLNDFEISNRKFTVAFEEKTPRGSRKVVDVVEFGIGETIDLEEFGLITETPMERAIREIGG